MKILMVNHGTASEWGGGDSVQIEETAKILKQRGHKVEIQNADRPNIKDADIVHIFNCRVPNSFIQQVSTCKKACVPVVVSPIWISIGRAIWGSRGSYIAIKNAIAQGNKSLNGEFTKLKDRSLIVEIDGRTINSDGKGTYEFEWQKQVSQLLNTVDGIIPNSWLELKAIQTDLGWKGDNYGIAHYGVDPKKFLNANAQKFREYSGISEDFVLQAGRIEPGKNQAMLCWALKNTDIPIVLIGSTKHWPEYGEICKQISGKQLTIIDHIPQDLLASAYAASRLHSLTSWMDTCGLVSLEAAINGTPVVGSTFGHELEYLKGDTWLADPADPEDIRKKIIQAWNTNKNSQKIWNLKERILGEYNWEKTGTETLKVYEKAIENA